MNITNYPKDNELKLPKGCYARPVSVDDLSEAVALFNLVSVRDYGFPRYTESTLKIEWQIPTFDLQRDTRAVFLPDDTMIAYGEVWANHPERVRIWAQVHPEHVNKGLGTYLMGWHQQRAHEEMAKAAADARVVTHAFYLSSHKESATLFQNHGFKPIRQMYQMRIDMTEAPAALPLPAGISLRTYKHPDDLRALTIADIEAFQDHWGFITPKVEEFEEEIRIEIEGDTVFDPSLWYLAINDKTGAIAGVALNRLEGWDRADVAYVQSLGVLRSYRRKGLARAMLVHSFRELFARGKRTVTLGVDGESLTGALRLYEQVGMHIEQQTTIYEKELRAGKEVMTQTAPDNKEQT